MARLDIAHQRLCNQRLIGSHFEQPAEVVAWLGAVQAQDYPGAKWGVGQRARGITDAAMDEALAEGAIVRTHVLRPTWHLVLPTEIRWLLALTAPRVKAALAYGDRLTELDAATLKRGRSVLAKALARGKHLTRAELQAALARADVHASGQRLGHLLMHAELDAVICSGPVRGKQLTYALLDERVPRGPQLAREEALCELTRRYFTSHGPATPRDFAWWSGLTIADANAGLAMLERELAREVVDGLTYWFRPDAPRRRPRSPAAYLLPNYDEYGIAYKDRGALIDPIEVARFAGPEYVRYQHLLVVDGRLVGGWRRAAAGNAVSIELKPFRPLTTAEVSAMDGAAQRFARFIGTPVVLTQAA